MEGNALVKIKIDQEECKKTYSEANTGDVLCLCDGNNSLRYLLRTYSGFVDIANPERVWSDYKDSLKRTVRCSIGEGLRLPCYHITDITLTPGSAK